MVQYGSVLILMFNLTMSTCYLMLASLLDAEFEERHLQSYYYGHIIGCYGLFATVSSFVVPCFLKFLGRSKVLYIGIVLMSLSIAFMGFITYIQSNYLMVAVAMACRSIQGFGRMFTVVPCVSILAILQPEERLKYMGLFEGAISVGCAVGPIIGSVLYQLLGFMYVFLIPGLAQLIYIPLMILVMPPNIDSSEETEPFNTNDINSEGVETSRINYCTILTDAKILLVCFAQLIGVIAYSYFEPLLSFRVAEFTSSVYVQGLLYTSFVSGLIIMSLYVSYLSKLIDPMKLMAIGLFVCGASNFFVGPSTLLPNNLIIMAVGLFFSGLTIILSIVPPLPIMIQRIESMFIIDSRVASDIASIIYTFIFSLGQFLGPIYGGYMDDLVGYRDCCDIMGMILIAYALIFSFLKCFCLKDDARRPSTIIGQPKNLEMSKQHSSADIVTTVKQSDRL